MSKVSIYKMKARKGEFVAILDAEPAEGVQVLGVGSGGTKSDEKVLADLKEDLANSGAVAFLIFGGLLDYSKFEANDPELVETIEL